MRRGVFAFVIGVLAAGVCNSTFADVPPLLSYQGRLRSSAGVPFNGTTSIKFTIYDAAASGAEIWAETQDVTVTQGLFTVLLGSQTPFPSTAFESDQRWLGLTVNGGQELTPRTRMVSGAFAYHSSTADIADSARTIADSSVTSAKIIDGTITAADIKGGTITGDKIASDAIVSSKILNGSIQGADIAASQITATHVVNNSLIGADILDGSITGSDIADGAIGPAEIIPNSLTGSEIADLSVNTVDIHDDAIISSKILNGAIGSPDMGINSVGSTAIIADAVSAPKILDEPGVAQTLNSIVAGIDLVDNTTVNLLTRSINCPASGYVLAIASCNVYLDAGQNRKAELAISEMSQSMPADIIMTPSKGALSDFSGDMPVCTQRVFGVSAGLHTFYFVGRLRLNWPGQINVSRMIMSLVYIPSAYGTVSGAAAEAPGGSEKTE